MHNLLKAAVGLQILNRFHCPIIDILHMKQGDIFALFLRYGEIQGVALQTIVPLLSVYLQSA